MNVTLPFASSSDPYAVADFEYYGLILYLILLVPTIFLNAFTIFAILSTKSLRSKINPTLVVYLAVADGFLSIFCFLSCTVF